MKHVPKKSIALIESLILLHWQKKKKTQKEKNETLEVYSETVPKEIANSRKILYLMSQPRCGGQSLLRSLFDLPESEFHYYFFFKSFLLTYHGNFLQNFVLLQAKYRSFVIEYFFFFLIWLQYFFIICL